jgi:hypothetical protein
MSRRHGHSLRPRCTQQDRICQAGEAAGCRCRCHGASWRLMVKRFAGSAPRVIAVRDCPRQRLGADIAARPHAVLHHDRSPEPGLKSFSEYARYEVDAAASREGDDQPHRPGGGLRTAVSWTAAGEADARTRATTGAMRFRKAMPPSVPVVPAWRGDARNSRRKSAPPRRKIGLTVRERIRAFSRWRQSLLLTAHL